MDALLNELAFQKVLLNSIDDTVQNRDDAEEEVRGEIRALEKQIRELRRSSTTASNSQPSESSQSYQKPSASSSKNPLPATGNGTSSASAMDGYLSEYFQSFLITSAQSSARLNVLLPIYHSLPILSGSF